MISGSFDEKPPKMGKKSPKIGRALMKKGLSHENNRMIEFFSSKDVSYNFTKSHQVSVASVDYSRSSR